jgi:hypothetical protein
MGLAIFGGVGVSAGSSMIFLALYLSIYRKNIDIEASF